MGRVRDLPLTRRGWAVLGVGLGGALIGTLFGARSLNAVVAPAFVALALAYWYVRSSTPPAVDRRGEPRGTVGDTIGVTVDVHAAADRLGRIVDDVGDGLAPVGNDRTAPLGDGLTYTAGLERRGHHRLGPTRVAVRDPLGLVERTETYANATEVLVTPRVKPLNAERLQRVASLADIRLERERHEFDRLREYHPGDSLRDVHWKTSAKRPDVAFIVKEFVKEDDRGAVDLTGEAVEGADDALADAMASLAVALARSGVRLGLRTADGAVGPVERPEGIDAVIEHLALVGPGSVAEAGDLHVVATGDAPRDVRVEIGDERVAFDELVGGASGADAGSTHGRALGVSS